MKMILVQRTFKMEERIQMLRITLKQQRTKIINSNVTSTFQMEDGYVLSVKTIIFVGESNVIDVEKLRLNLTSMVSLNICSKRAVLWVTSTKVQMRKMRRVKKSNKIWILLKLRWEITIKINASKVKLLSPHNKRRLLLKEQETGYVWTVRIWISHSEKFVIDANFAGLK